MSTQWEYKMLTLKRKQGGFFSLNAVPDEADVADTLNQEGARGWELVNAVAIAPSMPLRLFFKRPK